MQNIAPCFEEGTKEIFIFADTDLRCFDIATGALGIQKRFGAQGLTEIIEVVFAVKNDMEINGFDIKRR